MMTSDIMKGRRRERPDTNLLLHALQILGAETAHLLLGQAEDLGVEHGEREESGEGRERGTHTHKCRGTKTGREGKKGEEGGQGRG
jgi:hypothetical protein